MQILRNNIKGRLTNKLVAPLFLAGTPGTGKSTSVKLVAKELGFNLIEISAPSISLEQLSGLPLEYATPQFNEASTVSNIIDVNSTLWSIPQIIADVWIAAKSAPTILLIDDFHAMPQHLQPYFYNLLLEYKIGNYILPDNCVIVGTMNNSDKAGFNGMSSAIRNRINILELEFNFEYWFNSYGNKLHYLVASFLKAKPNYAEEDESTGISGFATARAWTAIAAELALYTPDEIHKYASKIAGMQVSREAAQAFQSHVNYVAALDFEKTVANRVLVDLSTRDPLDTILYSYITNFIHTIDDGMYLLDLMETNKSDSSSTFIGFLFGELYRKSCDGKQMSEGLTYTIDKLIGSKPDKANYPNTSADKLAKAFAKQIPSISKFQERAHEFLL